MIVGSIEDEIAAKPVAPKAWRRRKGTKGAKKGAHLESYANLDEICLIRES